MKNLIISLKVLLFMTIVTGVAYPLLVTGISQSFFRHEANGSLITENGKAIGSELIGQGFSEAKYFWGRPSAIGNNPMPSGGGNLSPVSPEFKAQFDARVDTIRKYHGNIPVDQIPKDLLFASGSGVDPDVSPSAVLFQVDRVSQARGFDTVRKQKLLDLINNSIESPDLLIFGEQRVNVLLLNLNLEKI
jgi:K+-transporting ATPase ATPase C chain